MAFDLLLERQVGPERLVEERLKLFRAPMDSPKRTTIVKRLEIPSDGVDGDLKPFAKLFYVC